MPKGIDTVGGTVNGNINGAVIKTLSLYYGVKRGILIMRN